MVGGLISSTWLVFRGFMYLNILFSPFFLAELTLSLPDSTFLVGLELCLDGINFSLGLVPSLFCESFLKTSSIKSTRTLSIISVISW